MPRKRGPSGKYWQARRDVPLEDLGQELSTLAPLRVVLIGAAADPLSIRAVAPSDAGAFQRRARSLIKVAALLIILLVTMGLAVRAGAYARQWNPTDSESRHEKALQEAGFLDACARTFVLVLLSLIGLLLLGTMYGNVLGSAAR
jgi:uncharacterized membrane protein YidH (DUF202 family)